MSGSGWRVAAASVCGSAHEKHALPCQDAHRWAFVAEGLLVAAVADGAGSAPKADRGAGLAVAAAVDTLTARIKSAEAPGRLSEEQWRTMLMDCLGASRSALEREAEAQSLPPGELATTLILAVAGPDFVAAAQVGDGGVVVGTAEARLVSVSRPPTGEYLNETIFLTSTDALSAAQTAFWRGEVAHLAMISDGLQMAALRMPGAEPHPGFFNPLFQFLSTHNDSRQAQAELAAFLGSPKLRSRTDDDVTLVLATRVP